MNESGEKRYWGLGPDAPEVKDEEMCPQCDGMPEFRVSLHGDPTFTCGDCGHTYRTGERENCIDCGKPLGSREVRCFSCANGGGE